MSDIAIIHEDAYGKEFYKILIKRLKDNNMILKPLGLTLQRNSGDCNTKLERILHTLDIDKIKGILIIRDGDGNKKQIHSMVQSHIPDDLSKPFRILIFDTEIEELILYSQGKQGIRKPSEYLKNEGYKKSKLADQARRLDLDKIKSHPVINELIEFWNNIASY